MRRAEQVVDGLDGVEGLGGNCDEYRVPVRHRAVPKAGQLERLDRYALAALFRYEAGGRVNVVGKVDHCSHFLLEAVLILGHRTEHPNYFLSFSSFAK